jgi:hypothetical protein
MGFLSKGDAMFYPSTNINPSEIKLFYQTYGANNSKPADAILFNPDLDQKFEQDVIDDLVGKGLWDETFEAQLENNQLYFKVFRDDEEMIPVDAIEFENVRLLPNRGLLGLDEPLQNALSRSVNWFGSFIPESVKQTAYDFGNSFAQWTEDKLTGLSAYSSIPKVKELDAAVWQERVEEGATESESTYHNVEENTVQALTTTSTSYLDSILTITWNALTYAANNPIKTLVLALAASSLANRVHLPKIKLENPSLDFTNGVSTATHLLAKLAIAQVATRGQMHTPMSTMLTGMSLWHSVAATTPEFQVNTHTMFVQQNPKIVVLTDGNFVVTWQSFGQDGPIYGIYAQRFNATGEKLGTEFLVNTYTTDSQDTPAIAGLANGSFVVTWQSEGQDGALTGVYGQCFNATGAKIGSEFQVNTHTMNEQQSSSVASFADGSFVVAWQSNDQDGAFYGVYGQRFNATCVKIGSEFQVNTYTTTNQDNPSVTSFADGNFVVTWDSNNQDTSTPGVYGQCFNSMGVKTGAEFQVNTYTMNTQYDSSVVSFLDSSFLVVWSSNHQGAALYDVYGQRFNATGAKLEPEFQVNTYTTNDQISSSVASFVDGSFVVTWQSFGQDGSFTGVYGQQFNAAGAKLGSEFRVNTYTTDIQQYPSVASFLDGCFVVTWGSNGQDGSFSGVYGRIFTPPHLGNNTLAIMGGQTKIITSHELSASALRTDPGTLMFIASDIVHGRFEFVTNLGTPIFNFTQQQVTNAQVQFVHTGAGFPPAYNVKVSEIALDTTPAPATIIFSNAMPMLTGTGGTLVFTEKNSATAIDPDILVFDADTSTLTNATIQFISSVLPEDILAFTNQAGISGVYNNATGILFLNGTSSVSNYQLALRNITYFNPLLNPSTVLRTVSFTVNDGQFNSNTVTRLISITPVSDAPALVGSGGSIVFIEKGSAVVIDPNIIVTDVDNLNIASAVIAITSHPASIEEILGFVDQNGISGNYNAGTLTLTGSSTIANYQAALRNVTYIKTASDAFSTCIISFTVNDGGLDSNTVTRTVTITPVNDAPILTAGPNGTLSFTEKDSARVIDPNIVVADVDSPNLNSATVRFISNVLAEDVLAFTTQTGISGSYSSSTGTLALTGSASLATYQLALRSVTYFNPSLNPSSAVRTISFRVNDGQLDSNILTRSISVIPVNDPPFLAVNTVTITGGQSLIFSSGQLQATDPDNAASGLIFTIGGLQFCRFERVDAAGFAITSFTQQDIIDGKIRFIASEATSIPTYQVSVTDGQLSTTPQAASVSFSEASPVRPSTPISAGGSDTIRNALIGAGVSAFIGFIAFALKYGIRRASNKKLQTALAAKENEIERQQHQYDDRVIKPIAGHINANVKIAAFFESVSTAKVNNFIMAVQTLASEMSKEGILYEKLSEDERNIAHRTIVKELKYFAHPKDETCCAALLRCGMFKAEITPQQIEENAETIAKAINKALNRAQFNAVARTSDPKTPHHLVPESVELNPVTATAAVTLLKPEAPRISTVLPKLAEEKAERQRLEAEMAEMKRQMAQLVSAQTGSPAHTPTPKVTSSDVTANTPPQRPARPPQPLPPRL